MEFDVTQFPIDFVFLDELQVHPENENLYGPIEADAEFTANIAEWGILNPPLVSVRQDGSKILIAGNRRVASAKLLDRFIQAPDGAPAVQEWRRAVECRLIRGLTADDEVAMLIADNRHRKISAEMRRKELHRLIAIGREIGLKQNMGIDVNSLALSPDTPRSLADVHKKHGKRFRMGVTQIREISALWGRIERESIPVLKKNATEAFNAGRYSEVRTLLKQPYTDNKLGFWQKFQVRKPRIVPIDEKRKKTASVDELLAEVAQKNSEIEILKAKLSALSRKASDLDSINARIQLENKLLIVKIRVFEPNFELSDEKINEIREKNGL